MAKTKMAEQIVQATVKRVIDSGDETYTVADCPKNLAEDAMMVQNAVNGTAVMNSLLRAIKELREKFPSKGGDWYNQHPIVAMYLNQLCHLNHGRTPDHPQMTDIWRVVDKAATAELDPSGNQFEVRGFEEGRDGGVNYCRQLPNGLYISVEAYDNTRAPKDGDRIHACVTGEPGGFENYNFDFFPEPLPAALEKLDEIIKKVSVQGYKVTGSNFPA